MVDFLWLAWASKGAEPRNPVVQDFLGAYARIRILRHTLLRTACPDGNHRIILLGLCQSSAGPGPAYWEEASIGITGADEREREREEGWSGLWERSWSIQVHKHEFHHSIAHLEELIDKFSKVKIITYRFMTSRPLKNTRLIDSSPQMSN